jgi:hypothetical protein
MPLVKSRMSFAALAALVTLGCSTGSKPYQTAPISGVVTLDGQLLAQAHVVFMPAMESQASRQSGPESSGDTDGSGHYSLKTVFGDAGASVGKNRVMITTRRTEPDASNPDRIKETAKEQVPGKYFTEQAPLFFEVSTGGSRAANFALTSH